MYIQCYMYVCQVQVFEFKILELISIKMNIVSTSFYSENNMGNKIR